MRTARLNRLKAEHQWLERQLRQELARPQPDSLIVQDLKRRRLQVRDEIFLIQAGLEPVRF